MPSDIPNEFRVRGEELLKKVRELLHEGNVRRILIKDDHGNTYMEIPLSLGVAGVVLAPALVAVGALAAMASSFTIEVVRRDQST